MVHPSGGRHCGSQQKSIRNAHTVSAYSHTLLLSYFTGRQEGLGHRVAHLPHKWLVLKVFHAFANFSVAPIRGLVPRANRSSLKITRKPIRMDLCGTEFSKNGPALEVSN